MRSFLKALEELVQLFKKWGLSLNDWCLVGEWALILQDYEIKGRQGIIDVYVIKDSMPWKVKKERQVIPPRDSEFFDQLVRFTEQTKFGLDMIPIPVDVSDPRTKSSIMKESTLYPLSSGKVIRINTPLAEVRIHEWLFQQYSAEDVGQENLGRWWKYIEDIKQAAIKKGDKKVVNTCEKLLSKKS